MADRPLRPSRLIGLVLVLCGVSAPAAAQLKMPGLIDGMITLHPQTAANDTTRALGGLGRLDPVWRFPTWRLDGSLEARFDSHDRTSATVTFWDRSIRRPALTVRRLSASWSGGPVTLEFGKQFVRWGKTDIVVPTERFAPRDYLDVVQTELLAVTAARLTVSKASDSLELVVTPRMTPSRTPLFDQRWVTAPEAAQGLPLVDAGAEYPSGPQVGARWNHVGARGEFSASFFRGFNHLPEFVPTVVLDPLGVEVLRRYPQLTSVGGDAAVPLPWFALKAEAAWLMSSTPNTEEFVLYVIQLERQAGEWLFIGGYAGELVTAPGSAVRFAPDRGLARAFVGRASYTIDTNRSLVFEGVVRQNGDGASARVEYSQAIGDHMRVTAGGRLIRGSDDDFLGRYRRNSSVSLGWRYTF